jgi:hypothetical protein
MEICGFEEILKDHLKIYIHQQLNMVESDVRLTVHRDKFL